MRAKILHLAFVSFTFASLAEAGFYIGVEGGCTSGPTIIDPAKLGNSNEIKFVNSSTTDIKNAFKNQHFSDANESTTIKPISGYSVGVDFGSEHLFLGNYLGFRWGASVGYSDMQTKLTSINQQYDTADVRETYSFLDAGVSLDAMVNFYSSRIFSIGVFGGAELEYHYLLSGKYEDKVFSETVDLKDLVDSRHSLSLVGRVGVSTMFADHHRIDFTAKLPIGSIMAGKASDVKLTQAISRTTLSAGYKFVF